jgi:hypothetical protein
MLRIQRGSSVVFLLSEPASRVYVLEVDGTRFELSAERFQEVARQVLDRMQADLDAAEPSPAMVAVDVPELHAPDPFARKLERLLAAIAEKPVPRPRALTRKVLAIRRRRQRRVG